MGYALAACGVVLLFVCFLARTRQNDAGLLRIILMTLAGLPLAGVLLEDAIQRLF